MSRETVRNETLVWDVRKVGRNQVHYARLSCHACCKSGPAAYDCAEARSTTAARATAAGKREGWVLFVVTVPKSVLCGRRRRLRALCPGCVDSVCREVVSIVGAPGDRDLPCGG